MYEWLPFVNHYFPGSSLNPFNVYDLSIRWWLEYAGRAYTQYESDKAEAKKARSGRGK